MQADVSMGQFTTTMAYDNLIETDVYNFGMETRHSEIVWEVTNYQDLYLGQELLLDFTPWIDLTSNADNSIISVALKVTEHILLL